MKFRVRKADQPDVYHIVEAGSVDEILRYLMAVHMRKRFFVDFEPWEGFAYEDGRIARDEHGIGLPYHSGAIEVTVYDRSLD